jgi:nitrogen fixation protein
MMKKEKNFFRTLESIYIHRRDVEESLLGVDGEGLANGGVLALVGRLTVLLCILRKEIHNESISCL